MMLRMLMITSIRIVGMLRMAKQLRTQAADKLLNNCYAAVLLNC